MSSESQNTQVASSPGPHSLSLPPDTVPKDSFSTFPPNWNPPKSFISRHIFKICCYIFTWHENLVWLHNLLNEGKNWEELHRQYLTQLNQVSIVQGLVLTTAAVFISSNPPLQHSVNYTSNVSYACMAESLIFSLFGLLFQLKLAASGFFFQKRSGAEIIIERRWRIFWHLLGLAVPIIIFAISVVLMLISIVLTGIKSQSESVQLYLSITFAFLGACHLVSMLGSPIYHHLLKLCINVIYGATKAGEAGTSVPDVERGHQQVLY